MVSALQEARRPVFDRTGEKRVGIFSEKMPSQIGEKQSNHKLPYDYSNVIVQSAGQRAEIPTEVSIVLLFALGLVARGQNCPITNAIKWAQYPDRTGLDVLAAKPPAGAAGQPRSWIPFPVHHQWANH